MACGAVAEASSPYSSQLSILRKRNSPAAHGAWRTRWRRQLSRKSASATLCRSASVSTSCFLSSGSGPPFSSRPFIPSPWEEDQDDSSFLNAICYPDMILEESLEEGEGCAADPIDDSEWSERCQLGSVDLSSALLPSFAPSSDLDKGDFHSDVNEPDGSPLSQQQLWRQGAAEAVARAEENYLKAWNELQLAEQRLHSTRQVAAELGALPSQSASRSSSKQSVDISGSPYGHRSLGDVNECSRAIETLMEGVPVLSGDCTPVGRMSVDANHAPTVDLGWDDGVWCIEACGIEVDAPIQKGDASEGVTTLRTEDAVIDAEGAFTLSRAALDAAARELISRLQEEERLQAEVIDRHIEVLDRGAQHQVARWLVDEMDALSSLPNSKTASCLGEGEYPSGGRVDVPGLAVPLDLDLAVQGYDDHAVRFLRNLPFDQVLKIRAVPPSKNMRLKAIESAERLERILAQPSGQPAISDSFSGEAQGCQPSWNSCLILPPGPQVFNGGHGPLDAAYASSRGGFVQRFDYGKVNSNDNSLLVSTHEVPSEAKMSGARMPVKYHSKLVLLGGCVCSMAAYMVANFELTVLAKDVAVILTAMSLAFAAVQFVWRNGDIRSGCEVTPGVHTGFLNWHGQNSVGPDAQGGTCVAVGKGRNSSRSSTSAKPSTSNVQSFSVGRNPSWEQMIWLIGGLAVVLSLSTMVALACKMAQAGLTTISTAACSVLANTLPGHLAHPLGTISGMAAIASHVSTSLWLVLGGEVISSGVESLGVAAAWAMLLLCVAFSIASAPICLASSTSRRVNELLALARSHC